MNETNETRLGWGELFAKPLPPHPSRERKTIVKKELTKRIIHPLLPTQSRGASETRPSGHLSREKMPKGICSLRNRGDGRDRRGTAREGRVVQVDLSPDLPGGVLLGAIPGDVASLSALVAGLAGGVEGATVGRGAVARDVAELAAGVALHGLSLTVTREVVGATALVAGRGAGAAGVTAAPEAEAATAHGRTAAHVNARRVGARALQNELDIVRESGTQAKLTAR